jgi:hypothetical protein
MHARVRKRSDHRRAPDVGLALLRMAARRGRSPHVRISPLRLISHLGLRTNSRNGRSQAVKCVRVRRVRQGRPCGRARSRWVVRSLRAVIACCHSLVRLENCVPCRAVPCRAVPCVRACVWGRRRCIVCLFAVAGQGERGARIRARNQRRAGRDGEFYGRAYRGVHRCTHQPNGIGAQCILPRRPHTHTRTHTLTHTHTRTHARTHAHTHAHTHTQSHTHARTHTHAQSRTHAHTRTRTVTHTHTRAYIPPDRCIWRRCGGRGAVGLRGGAMPRGLSVERLRHVVRLSSW